MPCFEVASASVLTIYGTAAACVWLCRLYLCCFAGVRPVLIVSVNKTTSEHYTSVRFTSKKEPVFLIAGLDGFGDK